MSIELFKSEIEEKPSDKVKYICYKILEYYDYDFDKGIFLNGDDEIGEGDIDFILDFDIKHDTYYFCDDHETIYLNEMEVESVYKYMENFADVVPGYVFEDDPDALINHPGWDDED